MDKLKAEIARKKAEAQALKDKKLQEQQASQGTSGENDTQNNQLSTSTNVSYIRQKDRILLKQQELEEKQQQLDEERQFKKLKINHNEEVTTKNNSTDEKLPPSSSNPDVSKKNSKIAFQTFGGQMDATPNAELKAHYMKLPTKDIQNILRKFNLPITLFGETKETRIDRLLQYLSPDQPEKSSNKSKLVADNTQTPSELTNQITKTSEDTLPTEEEEIVQEINKKPTGPPYDPTVKFTTMTQLTHEEMIYKYFKTILKQWIYDLQFKQQQFTSSFSSSSSSIKLPMNLKKELLNQQNCSEFIQPLFGLLKHKQLSHDLIDKLLKMVQYCEDGNFRLANDEYIRTAIGNSAWPIGLTMVGIHERSGRERISTSKIAHIMNNEQERKYLISVKQLMNYAQTLRPDVPPSMKVLS